MQMRCDKCGSVYAVAAENAELWIGAPCQRTTCGGFLEEYESGEINYYGRLYSAGDLVRINAREHTGLLERPDREQLEIDFKRSKDTQEICKQLLVDVDEDHDISSAYRMDNEDFPFGYEFVRKATLREINFGESDMTGEKLSVSGVEEVRKGFRICKYCGKIQPENGKANHSFACKTRKMPALMQANAYEECLFLYREFSTEILRLLVPATTMDSSSVKMESFVAAFMLGMKAILEVITNEGWI